MTIINPSYINKLFSLCLSLTLLTGGLRITQAQSRPGTGKTSLPERIIFQENFEPPGDPAPTNTAGAGSRDGLRCASNEQPIQLLMPKRNYGLTFEERPPVFIYLPKTVAKRVVLTFRDEAGQYYERTFLPITARGEIVSFTLPQEKPSLTIGRNYQWSLVVVCGDTVQPDDPTFKGWVQRVERTAQVDKLLTQKTAIWQAQWYGERGYWDEMLMAWEQAQKADSRNLELTALWQEFWQSLQDSEDSKSSFIPNF